MIKLKRRVCSPSNWLMIIGIAVSLVAFIDGVDLYYRLKYAQAEANDYRYLYEYRITINDPEVDIIVKDVIKFILAHIWVIF